MLLLLVIVAICCTFPHRMVWWAFIDVFCFFMGTFIHLMSTLQPLALQSISRKLDLVAMIFCLLGIVALIGEGIAFWCLV